MRIIIFIDWFYPSFKAGGPIKSVYNIVSLLKQLNDIRIITSAYDLDGTEVEERKDSVVKKEGYEVVYLTKNKQTSQVIREFVQSFKPDILYFNSIFSLKFTLVPLFLFKNSNYKIIIAPRGMLGEGALKLKAFKKRVFLQFAKKVLFSSEIVWHASTSLEKEEIKKAIGEKSTVVIAQNLSSTPVLRDQKSFSKKEGELNLIFLSRISEKKNLMYLIHLIHTNQHLKLKLDIYGPVEDTNYWSKCEEVLNKDSRIEYKGIIPPMKIKKVYQDYHFSVLPTLHENYGHSIAESINYGVPVIISKNTPWLNLKSAKVGYDISLQEPNEWLNTIKSCVKMDEYTYNEMVKSCLNYANQFIVTEEIRKQNLKLFEINE